MGGSEITASDWSKGIFLSILASIIGGISKLAIRKSWLLQADRNHRHNHGGGYGQGMVTADTNLLSNERECYDYTNTNIENDPSSRNNDAEVDDEGDGNEEQVIPNTGRNNPTLLPYSLRYSGMFGMSVLNPICCVLAMNYASPSILAPFSGLTLVWVILGSPLVNNEKPSNQQILACSFIIAGEVVVAIFGDHTNDENVTVNSVVS